MTEMTLTQPATMEDYIRERVEIGDFIDPADYVRDLIRADQRARRTPRPDRRGA